jgi:hypothetical protein
MEGITTPLLAMSCWTSNTLCSTYTNVGDWGSINVDVVIITSSEWISSDPPSLSKRVVHSLANTQSLTSRNSSKHTIYIPHYVRTSTNSFTDQMDWMKDRLG